MKQHEPNDDDERDKRIDIAKEKRNLGGFTLLRPKPEPGQCPDCLVVHAPELPHNQQSLFWQYNFMGKHGRWPTWWDAMEHCAHDMRVFWIKELAKAGVVVVPPKEGKKAK